MTENGMEGKSHRAPLKYKPGSCAADRPASRKHGPQAHGRQRRTGSAADRRPLRSVDIIAHNDNTPATRPRFTVGRRDFLPPEGGSTSPRQLQSILHPVLLALSSAPINSVPRSNQFQPIQSDFRVVFRTSVPIFSENKQSSSHTPPHTFLAIKKSVMFQRYHPRHILTRFHAFGNEKGVIWRYKINLRNSPQLHHVPGDRTMVRFSGPFLFAPILFPYI